MSSAGYMYQRRSVDDAPASPTALRSPPATQKCQAHTPSRTRPIHAAWLVDSQSVFVGHAGLNGIGGWGPTSEQVSSSGRRTSPAVIAMAIAAPTAPPRQARYR